MKTSEFVKLAVLSRLILLVLTWALSLLVIDDDKSVGLYSTQFSHTNPTLFKFLKKLVFYDGDFYLEIFSHGYQYESIFAFFPGMPFLLKIWCTLASWLFFFWPNALQDFNFISLMALLLNTGAWLLGSLLLRKYVEMVILSAYNFANQNRQKNFLGFANEVLPVSEGFKNHSGELIFLFNTTSLELRVTKRQNLEYHLRDIGTQPFRHLHVFFLFGISLLSDPKSFIVHYPAFYRRALSTDPY